LVNRGTMGVNSLPKTVTRQRRGCDLNPGPSALESSTLTTRLPSHLVMCNVHSNVCVFVWCVVSGEPGGTRQSLGDPGTAQRPHLAGPRTTRARVETHAAGGRGGGLRRNGQQQPLYTLTVVWTALASARETHLRRSDVTESMVTIRSPFCGYNAT